MSVVARRRERRWLVAALAALGLLVAGILAATALIADGPARSVSGRASEGKPARRWVAGWAAAMTRPSDSPGTRAIGPETIRLLIPCSSGGDSVRIQLSNRFGRRPVRIGAATIGIAHGAGGLIHPRKLTFAHRAGLRLRLGAQGLSDPVSLAVPSPVAQLAVSLWLPASEGPLTAHPTASSTTYLAEGNHASDVGGRAFRRRLAAEPLLSSVQVRTRTSVGTLVVIGGSAAEGGSRGLARALVSAMARLPAGRRLSVVDAGLAGNEVLRSRAGPAGPSLLRRFAADALELPGVRAVLILAGGEDIAARVQGSAVVSRLEAAYRRMTSAGHARHIRVLLGTLPPFGAMDARSQSLREEINGWIRTSTSESGPRRPDGSLEFDAVLRDRHDWRRLSRRYDSGDHLVPNSAGYRAMVRYADPARLAGGALTLPVAPREARSTLPAGATAMLDLGAGGHGPVLAPGAVGLSVEATAFAWRHLESARGNLAPMMRLLGPSVLRVGGDAGDLSFWTSRGERAPRWAQTTVGPSDLRRLAGLARAAGCRVVLQVNLGHIDPARAANQAAEAALIFGRSLVGIEIGNEPDLYVGHGFRSRRRYDFDALISNLAPYRAAIAAAAPRVRIVGPDFSATYWSMHYARSVGRRNLEITQHYYPLWACAGDRPSIDALIGAPIRAHENLLLRQLIRASAAAGRPAVLSETNSVGCRGAAGVSRTFSTALWALDWALRAGRAGVHEIQFHDLLERCTPRTYGALCGTGPSGALRLAPQPEFYGLLAAARLERGSFMHADLQAPSSLTAYATRDPGGRIHIALDDLGTGGASQPVIVQLPERYRATLERLVAPGLAATQGVRLGGAKVTSGGGFRPSAQSLRGGAGFLSLRLAPGSAAVLTLAPTR